MTSEPRGELEGLESAAPSDRARAAAWLVQHPRLITTRALMNALQGESVPQVRRLLLQVLNARQNSLATRRESVDEAGSGQDRPAAMSTMTTGQVDLAAMIRHELAPAIGWIRLAADSEIQSFGTSKTNDAVRKLQRRIDGLVALIKSGEALNMRRLSLPHVLVENWPDASVALPITAAEGEGEIDIETDEGMFSMLLSNVFQNAIDASVDAVGEIMAQATWGYTEQAYWVRVTNPFKGDRFALADVVEIGNSSKMTHQGQGLSLVKAVADRLGIVIALEGVSGTASFSLSGPRPHG